MSLLPQYKKGDCSIEGCGLTDTQGRKVGKKFICAYHYDDTKKKEQITKANERNKVRSLIQYQRKQDLIPVGTGELQRWFEIRHKEMKGVCQHCNGRTEKNRTTYKNSIAHILPKAYFKSVATHPLNWIELCFYGNSCHTNFDNKMLDLIELNCFDEVITKFVALYPDIAENEKKRIPQVLLQYIETEK